MKTKSLLAPLCALAAAFFCSCNKQNNNTNSAPAKVQDAEIQLCINTSSTKTTVRADSTDKKIKYVAALVFDDNDLLENIFEGTVTEGGKLNANIKTTSGTKKIRVLTNVGESMKNTLRGVKDMIDFNCIHSQLDLDNSSSCFMHIGEKDDANITSGINNVTIPVKRIVARIEIHKITNAITTLTDNTIAGKDFVIDGIYLINVSSTYSMKKQPGGGWFNCGEWEGEGEDLLADNNLNVKLGSGESYQTPHYFYCYPNTSEESCMGIGDEWEECRTRLVIKCHIGDVAKQDYTYYSIELPDTAQNAQVSTLNSNTTYSITSCTITRRGSDTQWGDVETGSISLTLTVTDWETGASYEYTI